MTQGRTDVLLVGSMPLPDAESVFRCVADTLGRRAPRIPDGETGARLRWIEWQAPVFDQHPMFEQTDEGLAADWRNKSASANWKIQGWHRLRRGVKPEDLNFGELGYAREAIASYGVFADLKRRGTVHADCRFQVAIPTPYNVMDQRIAPEQRLAVEVPYERRVLAEVDAIAAAVPHGELALQWDAAHEVQNLAGGRPHWFPDPERGIIDRLVRLGNHLPPDVELGFHFCYGSFAQKHFIEPTDTALMVRLANAVSARISRPIGWYHMPVPRERSDDAYFAPLKDLRLRAQTRMYLGLIHLDDGVPGAQRRMQAARRSLADFGVATECGFGRRDAETVLPLLKLHADVADQGGAQ